MKRPEDLAGLRRDLPEGPESAGLIGFTPRVHDPRCRNQCTSPNRPAHESPAKTGTQRGTNRKVVYCPCCNRELRRLDEQSLADEMRPPNLNPGLVAGKHVRFSDDICGYDVELLFDVKDA